MNRSPHNSAPPSIVSIFKEACQRSNPREHTSRFLKRSEEGFHVGGRFYPHGIGIWMLACGKAGAAQARAIVDWAGGQLKGGLVITPNRVEGEWPDTVQFQVATHPNPSRASEMAALRALDLCREIDERDVLICAISGGTSALLAAPRPPLELAEKKRITEGLLKSGADIQTVNILRQQFSRVKGGGLLAEVSGVVETIVYADIETPALDLIGSGPTLVHRRKKEEVLTEWKALRPHLNIEESLLAKCDELVANEKKSAVNATLNSPILCASPETLKTIATEIAHERGFALHPTSSATYGNTMPDLLQEILETIQSMKAKCTQEGEPQLAIWVREPVLKVSRMGNGGRNSHLALLVAQAVQGSSGVAFLAAGSDGIDGNSKCAGAVVTSQSWSEGISLGLNPEKLLSQFDSAEFHEKIGGAVITGPTGTNLTDLHLLWVGP